MSKKPGNCKSLVFDLEENNKYYFTNKQIQ